MPDGTKHGIGRVARESDGGAVVAVATPVTAEDGEAPSLAATMTAGGRAGLWRGDLPAARPDPAARTATRR